MKHPTNKKAGRKAAVAYLVSAPSLVLIFLIVVFPILYTVYISLTNMNTYHWFNFDIIGLRNYERALLVFDSGFLSALLMTVVWTAVNMVMQLVIAFLIANLLNVKHLPLRNVYKTILMFPWAMPGYVSILLWKTGMFNSEFGLLTQWMEDLSGLTVRWLQNDVSAFICCTVVNLWLALPFMIMIMEGGLKSIDRSYYESATLDGAGPIRQAISITLPCLKPITEMTYKRGWERICRTINMHGATAHVLRHTYITMAAAHLDIKTLQTIAGHSDISTTMNRYAHGRED